MWKQHVSRNASYNFPLQDLDKIGAHTEKIEWAILASKRIVIAKTLFGRGRYYYHHNKLKHRHYTDAILSLCFHLHPTLSYTHTPFYPMELQPK
jgi:hypothetical protein